MFCSFLLQVFCIFSGLSKLSHIFLCCYIFVCSLYQEIELISVYWSCILQPFPLAELTFLIDSIWVSIENIMKSVDKDGFTFSFLILMSLITFSWLVALARAFSQVLTQVMTGDTLPYAQSWGKVFSLSPLSRMLPVGTFVSDECLFIRLGKISSTPSLLLWCWILSNIFLGLLKWWFDFSLLNC